MAKKKTPPRKNAALVGNPPIWTDGWEVMGPAVGSYAATRVLGRVSYSLAKRRSPTLAKHLAPWLSVGAAAAIWLAAHRIKALQKYHDPLVAGAAIAALQGLLQAYLPRIGWLLGDYYTEDILISGTAKEQQRQPAQSPETLSGHRRGALGTSIHDPLDDVLGDDESVDDLYTGNFAGGSLN